MYVKRQIAIRYTTQSMLQELRLQNFRSHRDLIIPFNLTLTVITGDNGSGKTSVIEALQLLSTGQSFRAERVEEMIAFDEELATISAKVDDDELEIMLTRGVLQGKRTQLKHYRVNGVKKRAAGLVGKLRAVSFRPEDLRLIEGSPGRRRAFLNSTLSTTFPDYARSLTAYDRTLLRRNKLLQAVREGDQPKTSLQYWNMSLVKHGEILQQFRRQWFEATNEVDFPVVFKADYKPSLISEAALADHQGRAIAAGHTLIGPHKDDFAVSADVTAFHRGRLTQLHDVAAFGSRGQQRLAVLWLKTCELTFLESQTQEKAVLLLDDILSELDEDGRQVIFKLIKTHQSVLTSVVEPREKLASHQSHNL